MKTTHVIIHSHEYNETVYPVSYVGPQASFPDLYEFLEKSGIDFEPSKGESLTVFDLQNPIDLSRPGKDMVLNEENCIF